MHEKSTMLILNDYESSFCDMLSTLNETTIHQRFINTLLMEVYKHLNDLIPELMDEVFNKKYKWFKVTKFTLFLPTFRLIQ